MKPLYPATLSAYVLCTRRPPGPGKELKAPAEAASFMLPHSLAELCGLQVAGWVFIACHYCSATEMLGAAPLNRAPLLPSAHRNCPLAGLPKELLLRNQVLLSRFAAPGGFSLSFTSC